MRESEIESAWRGPPQCESCGIRELVLFADLEREDFSLIHEPVEEVDFRVGETLYRAGESPPHVFTVRSGLVKLVQYLPNGAQRIVRLLKQGDVAGLERLAGRTLEHDATALEPVSTCRIPVSVVERLGRDTPRLHGQLMNRWQRAVSAADAWLTELSTGPAKARVARLIIHLIELSPGHVFYLPGREDMGAMLGITTETASRTTAEFRREGLLQVLDGNRAKAELEALRSLAED